MPIAAGTVRPRILFINRSYWPDVEASGQLLTELCEGLADQFDVQVLAGRPNNNAEGDRHRAWGCEFRNGVTIYRVPHTRFSKQTLLGRAINLISFLTGAWIRAWRIKPTEIVITETDPFLLPLLGSWIKRRGENIRFAAYLQDLYPDIAVGLGKVREGFLTKTIRRRLLQAYAYADSVIVLSGDMQHQLESHGVASRKIRCIPNWVDCEKVYPAKDDNRFRER
ncbi:MAG: glycosyltransferase, partial [Planctomycetaceae bacterium]